MARAVSHLAVAILLLTLTIEHIHCHPRALPDEDNNSEERRVVVAGDKLPASWEDAIHKMMDSLLGNPTEASYEIIAEQVLKLKTYIDEVFQDSTEERRDQFINNVADDIVKAVDQKSRVPLKFRIPSVVRGRIIEEFGQMPTKKPTKEDLKQMMQFADKLNVICKADAECKNKVKL